MSSAVRVRVSIAGERVMLGQKNTIYFALSKLAGRKTNISRRRATWSLDWLFRFTYISLTMHHQLPAQRNIAALEDGRICRVTEYIYEKHFQKEMVDPDEKYFTCLKSDKWLSKQSAANFLWIDWSINQLIVAALVETPYTTQEANLMTDVWLSAVVSCGSLLNCGRNLKTDNATGNESDRADEQMRWCLFVCTTKGKKGKERVRRVWDSVEVKKKEKVSRFFPPWRFKWETRSRDDSKGAAS